jgi:hypothetical protein
VKHKIKPAKTTQNHLFIIPVFVGIILFYIWLSISGSAKNPGATSYYYSYLADAFLDGNLYLAWQPDPLLLAMDNPYDPQAREELGKKQDMFTPGDFSLYEGKFYLYWGPVPGLLLAAIQFFLPSSPVDDSFLAFAFGIGILFVQSLLILTIRDYSFPTLPKWILGMSIVLAGLTWPIALLRSYNDHARIYQAAIAAGQLFLISGLLMVFTAIARPTTSSWRLALAGFFWVLAIGSRHLLVVPIFFMCTLTTLWIIRGSIEFAAKVIKLISLSLPLVIGGAGLGWYNWARFDSITETGFSYALSGTNLQKHSSELFSGLNIIPNLYNYLFSTPGFTSKFPFVSMLQRSESISLPFYRSPEYYYAEPIIGLIYLFPFVAFAIIPLVRLLSKQPEGNRGTYLFRSEGHRLLAWMTANLTISSFMSFLLITFFFWAGMRYLGDFLPLLTVLSVIGFWQGYQLSDQGSGKNTLYILTGIILASISIIMGILLPISTVYS